MRQERVRQADRNAGLQGANLEQTRAFNRRAVFDAVRRHSPVTRAELAEIIGLTVQGISNIAAELESAGLIRQEGKRAGKRGQPAVELSINPSGGYTIGLSLSYRRMTGVLVDLAGEAIVQETRELQEREPPGTVVALKKLTQSLLERSGIPREQIWGIGCSVPGTVENGAFWYDKVQEAEVWTRFPLAAELERGDRHAGAGGERRHGGRNRRANLWRRAGCGQLLLPALQPRHRRRAGARRQRLSRRLWWRRRNRPHDRQAGRTPLPVRQPRLPRAVRVALRRGGGRVRADPRPPTRCRPRSSSPTTGPGIRA